MNRTNQSEIGSNDFQYAEELWLQQHRIRRRGERLHRLDNGYGRAERDFVRSVWWVAFQNFNYLHPEYEVMDFRDGRRFIDLAYVRAGVKIAFEVDGFGTHYDRLNRQQFCNQWIRQMHLVNDGWIMVRIGWDDLSSRPRVWQQLIQQLISRYFLDVPLVKVESVIAKAILRRAASLDRPLKISDVRGLMRCTYRTARKMITSLEEAHLLIPTLSHAKRSHTWRLNLSENQLTAIINDQTFLTK